MKDGDNLSIGQNIKDFRLKKHLTQKQLADKISQTPTSIMHYEKGDREPNIECFPFVYTIQGFQHSCSLHHSLYD